MNKIFSGIMLILLSTSVFLFAVNIQIAKAGTITVPDNYQTIQAAINHALPGDTVFVRSGTYYEDVVVNKSISLIGENRDTTIIFGGNASSVVLVTSNNATVTGFTIRNNEMTEDRYGIRLLNVEGCNVSMNSLAAENLVGILLATSSHNKIVGNTFTGNGLAVVAGSFKNTVANNTVNGKPIIYLEDAANQTVTPTGAGQVILVHCVNVTVQDGEFSYTSIGAQIRNSNSCKIINNAFTNSFEGISTGQCLNNQIVGNNLTNTVFGLVVYNVNSSVVSGNRVANNTQSGIYLGRSSNNNTVAGNNIKNNGYGIWLSSSSNNIVTGNNITGNNIDGIAVQYTSYINTVAGNNIENNWIGIELYCLNRCQVIGNNIKNNLAAGVSVVDSSNNTVADNNITGNQWYGVWLAGTSNDNAFYHNNFISNARQVQNQSQLVNIWDNGYPSGGNYWSDYNGTDVFRGVYQNETGSDGIGDTPNVIDPQNIDNYPLTGPFGPLTMTGENITVFPSNNVGLVFQNVTTGGSTTVNKTATGPAPLSGYKIEGQYFDIQTTATYSGNITIRIIYDDTNMTLQEEESLQLTRWDETTQQWMNITTHVDTESNVIYGETNHLSIFAVHSLQIHDLSIFAVHAYKTIIGQGYTLNIDVDVRNEGDFPEDFDVTVDLVSGQISYLSIFGVHLVNGNTMTVTFSWNTANYARGDYTIVAHVSQVPYEIDTSDNTYPDGTVKVTIPGDVNGDFLVDIKDASQIGVNWQRHVPPAPANADVNGDGIIDIKDASIIGVNWQKHA